VQDFNACPSNNFGELLSQFCLEHELKISDKIILPVDSFTYVSDAHGTCSWLDHVVSSKSAHDSIQNIEILHQFIRSDRMSVAPTIKTAAIPQNLLCDNKTKNKKNMKRNKVTQQQKLKYQQAGKIWLSKIPLFEELTSCDNAMCKKQQQIHMLQQFYNNRVETLKRAASEVLTNSPKQKHNIPGWNKDVREMHKAA